MGWGTSWKTEALEEAASHGWTEEILKERQNKIPTHDPYTNPNAFIYYKCDCGEVLNPKTKSFASLNNHASNAGWKIRWGSEYYVPYCPKCANEKGIE